MNTTPVPSSRLHTTNLNHRSRSPSPSARPATHNPSHVNGVSRNHLDPGHQRVRRSSEMSNTEHNPAVENIPLIDEGKFSPPLANPENDESGDDREVVNAAYPGVDDGFFSSRLNPDDGSTTKDIPQDGDDSDGGRRITPSGMPMSPTNRNKPLFPDLELGTDFESIPDVNVYQHKKTLAQGMMDLALFSANANQLRYVLESSNHPYYYPGIVLITISLLFQVGVGVGLIWNSRYNVKDEKEICIANKINNFTIIGIFFVTVINVFISAFGVASVQPVIAPPATTP